jgi:hypothetical protein
MMKRINLWALVLGLLSIASVASADWATGVTTATSTLSTDLIAVGGVVLGLVCLIYGFRVVKGMLRG